MTRAYRTTWACGLAALALAVGGGAVASRAGQPPAAPARGEPAGRDAEVEALRKEVEGLRRKLDGFARKGAPQKVAVATPAVKDVVVALRYPARVHASRHIHVRTLLGGYVEQVRAAEGRAAKKDEVLFQVLPVLYKARYDAERAEAQLAELEYRNTKKLYEQKVVSVLEVQLHEAKLARAQAKVKLAEAELNFTSVRAPFDGLVGRIQTQAGSLVKEGDDLTTLSDASVVWVYFDVPETQYLRLMDGRDRGPVGKPVELVLADGRKFAQAGKLAAIEPRFDGDAGVLPFRADFPNPDGLLRHGQSATVEFGRESLKAATVVPRWAVGEDRGRRFVYLVGRDGVARRRQVEVRGEVDDALAVEGVPPDARVVLDARQVVDGERLDPEFRRADGPAEPGPDGGKK